MDRHNYLSHENDQAVERILGEWSQCNSELAIHFKSRESDKTLPVMKKAIDLFNQLLAVSNGLNQTAFSIKDCKIKPVNVDERLDFIGFRPQLFHSYKQLAELFAEQEKQYVKHAVLNRAKKKRPD